MKLKTLTQRISVALFLLAGSAWASKPAFAEASTSAKATAGKPNVILILTDDQGYQDLGCYGAPKIKTPHLDQMAQEGARFTDFYAPASLCSPSRAGMLTGRYPARQGIHRVFFPHHTSGMPVEEITIAELLKTQGYKTAAIGKWHLGHLPKFLPTNQGFDSYYGIPFSNDMWADPKMTISSNIVWREGADLNTFKSARKRGPVPLMRNTEVMEYPVDQSTVTRRYTDETIKTIDAAGDAPFFIFLGHTMPHVPLYASAEFEGKSAGGLYGDTIEELDYNVGRILDHLKANGLAENTLVLFTSDNGPWQLKGNKERYEGGSAKPLRGYKFGTYEGGMREPFIAWWPGTIPAGKVCSEPASGIDLLPTIAGLSGAAVPSDRVIDGKDIWPLMVGAAGAKSPQDSYFYYSKSGIEAVRQGDWKLRIDRRKSAKKKKGGKQNSGVELYNLREDISESNNLATQYPERVAEMKKVMETFDAELQANARPPVAL
ncbi:Arylsulfatase [Pontiella desulfatans]|uniref:Arylsulfatase n=1 Tax=Pontiella desulfatans TaxID=2750659 RepID=A0A6C2U0Q3_PONDE|nr:sulfatase [Pontiella desulfatans]SPS73749.1 sulfatase S1_14 [Kiritimatiellales bacterium]VGO13171.1 Arylsulfatase [Pontiella desulfatans]